MSNSWLEEDILDLITKEGEIPVHRRLESHEGLRNAISKLQCANSVKEVHVNRDYRYYAMVTNRSEKRSKGR